MPKSRRRTATRKNSAPARAPIVLSIRYVDGGGARKVFKTLAGARKWAQEHYGRHQDWGPSQYVTDNYGSSTMRVSGGATLADLFPEHDEPPKEPPAPCESCRKITDKGVYSEEGEWDEGRLSRWQEWHPYCLRCQKRDAAARAKELAVVEARRARYEAMRLSGHPDYIPF